MIMNPYPETCKNCCHQDEDEYCRIHDTGCDLVKTCNDANNVMEVEWILSERDEVCYVCRDCGFISNIKFKTCPGCLAKMKNGKVAYEVPR